MPDDVRQDVAVAKYQLRAELRSSWRSLLTAALVLGIASAVSLAALAGARRTSTVFTRFVSTISAADVMVLPESPRATDVLTAERLESLPGVVRASTGVGFLAARTDGTLINASVLAPADNLFAEEMEVPVVREGRLPQQAAPAEFLATPAAARELELSVGDSIDLIIAPDVNYETVDQYLGAGPSEVLADIGERHSFTLVGIGIGVGEASDPTSATITFTKAFYDAVGPGPLYTGLPVDLEQGQAGIPSFEAAVTELAPGEPVSFTTQETVNERITRALRPQVMSLTVFGIVMAVAGLASWSIAAARRERSNQTNDRTLLALGVTRRTSRIVTLACVLLVALVAAPVAVVVAFLASGLMPVSEARRIEPSRGFDFDRLVLVGGGFGLVLAATFVGLLATTRRVRDEGRVHRASRVDSVVRRSVTAPTVSTGVSHALHVGRTPSTRFRSALISATGGIALIVGVFTFAAGFKEFVSTPRSFGWSYDVAIDPSDISTGNEGMVLDGIGAALAANPDVRGWAMAGVTQALVGGRPDAVMAVGQLGGEAVNPTVVSGRAPAARDEVALGSRTARAIHASIGDVVAVGQQGREREFTVVGFVVLPGMSSNSLDAASLGGGALLTVEGISDALQITPDFGDSTLIVDLRPGASVRQFSADITAAIMSTMNDGFDGHATVTGPGLPRVVDYPVEPREIVAYRAVQSTPMILGLLLALLAAATVGHALVTSVCARRQDFGTLQALGFTRGQVRATVAWQATATAVVASLIGIPIGVLVGRQAWALVARQLGIAEDAVVPWLIALMTVPIAAVAANLVAALPGRAAAAASPAESLRNE